MSITLPSKPSIRWPKHPTPAGWFFGAYAAALLSLGSCGQEAKAQTSEWMARTRNEAGGEIVLLTNRGTCPEGAYRMFAAGASGRITWSCFLLSSTHVHVVYDNGDNRAYDFNGWTVNPVFMNQKQKGSSL